MGKIIQFPPKLFEDEKTKFLKKYNLPKTLILEKMLEFKSFEQIKKEVENLDIETVLKILAKLQGKG